MADRDGATAWSRDGEPSLRTPRRGPAVVRCTLAVVGLSSLLGLCAAAPATAQMRPSRPAVSAPVQPAAVFGSDDRAAVPGRYRHLRERIGLLFNARTRSVCTAFCVAPDIIATAGHCLYPSAAERLPRVADFQFAPNYETRRGLVRLAGAGDGPLPQFALSGGLAMSVRPPIEAARDWAMLRLAQPACKSAFAVRAMPADQVIAEAAAGRVFQLAYHRDFQPYRLAYSSPCTVERNFPDAEWAVVAKDFSEPGHILLHTCDTGGSSSGSPILVETPTGPEVVGINVGTYEQSKVEMAEGRVTRRGKSEKVANTGVSALAFAAKLDILKQAVILSSPGQIRALQQALKQRGSFQGAVDGRFSADLRRAIEGYERAQGLAVTGLATVALLKRVTTPLTRAAGRVPG
ncbi:MAG: peptidoglycan-binding protein [Hyphomicrobiaceae bacterium]|nr:peptidoglycan-binding protein [Hyphomicrobiaceae bacterium]